MSEGHSKAAWNHTAVICTMIHNVNCTKKSEMKKPTDFMPSSGKNDSAIRIDGENISLLKDAFVGKPKRSRNGR